MGGGCKRDERAVEVEATHHLIEAGAFGAESV